jgi:hypothetical protein
MKKLTLAAFIFSVLTIVAHAQVTPVADVAGGYSFIGVVKGYSLMANGASGSLSLNVNNWLGAVGDFGLYHASPGGPGLLAETYTFGPRFSYRRLERLIPFGQLLIGGGHASQPLGGFTGVSNAFAFGAGGGADIGLDSGGRFALRPQVEYLGFRGNGITTGTVRVSAGIVFRFGRKQ